VKSTKSAYLSRVIFETLGTRDRKATDKERHEYSQRLRPYRTTNKKIGGAMITLVDLEGKKDSCAGKTPHRAKQGSPRR
jgi:hypothetical protein